MLKYIYIDESGDLGIKGSKYLILAALLIDEPAELDRIIKNMRRNKFKKELKNAQEIKANKSSKEIIEFMIRNLNHVKGAKLFYVILEKGKIKSNYLMENKNRLYNYVAGKLTKHMMLENFDVEIRIDKSKGKQLLREDFNNYFKAKLHEKSSTIKAEIYHSYSHSWSGLQFADALSWSCFQKFEHSNSRYTDLIEIEKDVYYLF
ncbi:MAG: hypothetical protein COS25_01880 [Candidatus Nealsonbacteria bacterium CG02_land_8_20_14_3_00_37_10]|uniref:DUF3800 domain-containing protein n=1 Tax=Candidatus Nealsonbacteria bacterium CG02_land_8_20_14_3_00_37_10 TaxID=1974699 RepID=A0A2M7D9D3_9BACT|nr:MAG: hypothetical protein COS25_01880 [Candidatus Nealsonbacteria bacterium CG02_land_8_20_14_3_00_37_10]